MQSALFSPFESRSITLPNRVVMSPMANYSAIDGVANDWHFVHYGKMAQGGVGTIIVESTSISFQGHGTYGDLGIWNDEQALALGRIAKLIEGFGVVPGIQIGHAGRKAALQRAFEGYGYLNEANAAKGEKPWRVVGPSPIPFAEGALMPVVLTDDDLDSILDDYESATRRVLNAGFKILEIHAAHGYLLNQFLSPLANQRKDKWGGDAQRRMAFPLEVVKRVRASWPEHLPLWIRVSAIDDAEGGRSLQDTQDFVQEVKKLGVDAVDCSAGGFNGLSTLKLEEGYQVPFAREIRWQSGIPTVAVGLIRDAKKADGYIKDGSADLIALGRELLVNPN